MKTPDYKSKEAGRVAAQSSLVSVTQLGSVVTHDSYSKSHNKGKHNALAVQMPLPDYRPCSMKDRPISPRQAIARKCKDCTYDTEAAGNWRQQTATCPIVDCPLWVFRPLHSNAPAWLAERDVSQLPSNWRLLAHVEAVAAVAAKAPNGCEGTPFRDNAAAGDSCTPVMSVMPVNAAYQRYSEGGAG
jgi:hypothetical protein